MIVAVIQNHYLKSIILQGKNEKSWLVSLNDTILIKIWNQWEGGEFISALNSKQQTILKDIFEEPVKSNIEWTDVESLFRSLGTVTEGKGSRVRAFVNGKVATFHRPHPKKEADKGTIKSVRRFLKEAGIEP